MKRNTRLAISVFLVALFTVTLITVVNMLVIAVWLNGYTPVEEDIQVAVVEISESVNEESGSYHQIRFTEILRRSALQTILQGKDQKETDQRSQEFKHYQDQIAFRSRVVTPHSSVILFNFNKIIQPYLIGETMIASEYDAICADVLDGPNIFNSPFFSSSSISTPILSIPAEGGTFEVWYSNGGIEWRQ